MNIKNLLKVMKIITKYDNNPYIYCGSNIIIVSLNCKVNNNHATEIIELGGIMSDNNHSVIIECE